MEWHYETQAPKQPKTIVAQQKQPVSETIETDVTRLRRDAATYYKRSLNSKEEETRSANLATYQGIKAKLLQRGIEVIEHPTRVETIDPLKN